MLRDGGGRGMLRSFLLGQLIPGMETGSEDVVGQFGGGPGELAKAETVANQQPSPMSKAAGMLGGNPDYSGWNFGALANDMVGKPQGQQAQEGPWGGLIGILNKKYNGGF